MSATTFTLGGSTLNTSNFSTLTGRGDFLVGSGTGASMTLSTGDLSFSVIPDPGTSALSGLAAVASLVLRRRLSFRVLQKPAGRDMP